MTAHTSILRKAFAFFLLLAAAILATPQAYAQTDLVDAVFSAAEKRIIRDHFGAPANAQTPEDNTAPDWAMKESDDDQADDAQADDQGDDEDRGDKGKGKKDKDKTKGKDKDKAKGKSGGLPPGLAKREQLPPGLAKQLAEKGRLPPGLAKRDLPADLAAKLPARPEGQEVTVVESDVVLVDKTTGIILDVIKDVVNNGVGGGASTPAPDGTLTSPSSQDQGQDQGAEENLLDAVLKSIFGGGN